MSDIETRLAELAKRLDDLTSKEADRRLSGLVDEAIGKWERRRGALVLLVLGILGLASYSQLNQQIADHFTSKVVSQIDMEVKKKTANISIQDPAIAELQTRTAEMEKRFAQTAKPSPSTTPSPTLLPSPVPTVAQKSIAPITTQGFAFFGVRDANGSWPERYFSLAGAGDRPPQLGDEAVAQGSVNVRAGYIVYGPSGWKNERATGVLRQGDKVKVVEAKEVVGGFWWISFIREMK